MKRFVALGLLFSALLAASTAECDPIVTSAKREVSASIPPDGPVQVTSSAVSGLFDELVSVVSDQDDQINAQAQQTSNILPSEFVADGFALATAISSLAPVASSIFEVVFELTVPHLLTGSVDLFVVPPTGGIGNVVFTLTGPGTNLQFSEDGSSGVPQHQMLLESLGPGQYELGLTATASALAELDGFDFGLAFFGLSAVFEPQQAPSVPEPATVVLLAVSAAACALARRLTR